jgi:hypothetical protein
LAFAENWSERIKGEERIKRQQTGVLRPKTEISSFFFFKKKLNQIQIHF